MPDVPVDLLPTPAYPQDMETRIAFLEHIATTTAATHERLEKRQDQLLDRMDRRFDAVDRRFETVDRRFEAANNRHRTDFLWTIGLQLATTSSVLMAMARGFKWF
jgi:hypothetical protein